MSKVKEIVAKIASDVKTAMARYLYPDIASMLKSMKEKDLIEDYSIDLNGLLHITPKRSVKMLTLSPVALAESCPMTDLILRPSGFTRMRDDEPLYALQIRDHGPVETDYSTITRVDLETAKAIVEAGKPFWLFGEPTAEQHARNKDDVKITKLRHAEQRANNPSYTYRKKPVSISAVPIAKVVECIESKKLSTLPDWVQGAYESEAFMVFGKGLDILTEEGKMHGSPDDMLIKGVEGELYACKPSIFAKTYEEE